MKLVFIALTVYCISATYSQEIISGPIVEFGGSMNYSNSTIKSTFSDESFKAETSRLVLRPVFDVYLEPGIFFGPVFSLSREQNKTGNTEGSSTSTGIGAEFGGALIDKTMKYIVQAGVAGQFLSTSFNLKSTDSYSSQENSNSSSSQAKTLSPMK